MHKPFILFLLLALLLSACQPPDVPAASATPPLPPAATTPAPLPTQAPAPLSTPTLAPTASPAVAQPSATLAAGQASAFTDCNQLPGLAACGGKLPLTGKLVVNDTANLRLALVDFMAGTAWQEPSPGLGAFLSFSPSGKVVAVRPPGGDAPSIVYDVASGNKIRSAVLLGVIGWMPPDILVANQFRTVWSPAGDQAWIDYNTGVAHLRLVAQPENEVKWPLSADPGDRIAQVVAWVPGTDLLLFEQHTAGNSMWITGGSLYTLNVKNGAIKDLRANMGLTYHYHWQAGAAGVMVYADTSPGQANFASLYLLNVVTGSRKAVELKSPVNVSNPDFTPDGQSILFGASLPADQLAVNSPFALPAIYLVNPATGAVHALTQPPAGMSDTQPQLLPDGQNFLFYRYNEQQQIFSLRLGSLSGGLDLPVTGSLPLPQRTGPDYSFDGILVYQP